ncbi:hypothetical protein [Paenibacillus sp. S150]|uniref:hypothetical protein n=1 Tax=Paenibacillus sp. S150 TaxID=2749826 RepID=UPI001C58E87F|nr:hypothetical protein [Paenibacillus sp. S150]MBW4084940.1 hypothetical protein [Paenibacillus sp. S150]
MKKIIKYCLILLFVTMLFSSCTRVAKDIPDSNLKEVLRLQGESKHWKADYIIRESVDENIKYHLDLIIYPLDLSEIMYSVAYQLDSPGVSHLSGTLGSESSKNSVFVNNNDSIFSRTSSNNLPREGEDITLTIKWNDGNEEHIAFDNP